MSVETLPPTTRNLDIRVGYNLATDDYDLYLVSVDTHGRVTHVAELVMKPYDGHGAASMPPASLSLHPDEATRLAGRVMESLSRRGFKPPSESKLEGVLEAQGAHLADMRRLVDIFTTGRVVLPASAAVDR